MDDYVEAKARLFSMLPLKKTKSRGFLGSAILNIDEPYVRTFADNTKNQVLYYGLSPRADVWARDLRMTSKGTDFVLVFKGEEAPVSIGIPGTFNVYNALAASAVALSLGFPLEKVMRGLVEAKRVKGRLEVLAKDTPYAVWVDYAHTPESLENVLNTARNMTSNRVISVFGCGGDRDPSKRPIMGGISAKLADLTIITSDNPRTENPSKILDQIERGIKELARPSYLRIEDRREAIKEAIKRALPGDIVVIAGKGHENYQVIGTTKTHFDDGEEASRAIEELEGI
jgi:UDP-N-acetylmuramoyl-L-alanyl-D-glutamate--2,6-diaminopimelate ligase